MEIKLRASEINHDGDDARAVRYARSRVACALAEHLVADETWTHRLVIEHPAHPSGGIEMRATLTCRPR